MTLDFCNILKRSVAGGFNHWEKTQSYLNFTKSKSNLYGLLNTNMLNTMNIDLNLKEYKVPSGHTKWVISYRWLKPPAT